MEFEIGQGMTMPAAVEEGSRWVRALRKTNDFNSVRLYTHLFGPKMAVYILAEPKTFAVLGNDALEKADPALITDPIKWAGHSDHILVENVVR